MKASWQYIIILLIFTVILLPWAMVEIITPARHEPIEENPQEKKTNPVKKITIYRDSSKDYTEMPLEEYVKGVVAAEMPASFELEALKAQAVCARTYVLRRCKDLGGDGCNLHPEADICDSPSHCQAMVTKTEMLKKWGIFAYYHYHSKVSRAVESTSGMVIEYEGDLIDPLFFSTSNGKTENSEDVWDKVLPYLRSVTSPGEEISNRFLSEKEYPIEEVAKRLREKWPQLALDKQDPTKGWRVEAYSTGGRIKTLDLGGELVRGTEIRTLFALNSTDIKWKKSGKNIKFTCRGFGHGVGMSQYGANAMAKEDHDYKGIIEHYYTGVQVKNILD